MFQIRRIFDDVLPADRQAIAEVQKMFCEHFSEAPAGEIEQLTSKLRNPFHRRFRTILCVAENRRNRVTGFAIVLHDPEVHFCYLDYLASGSFVSGRGVGAALYEYVRGQALGLEAEGLFFECLPDDPERCADEKRVAKTPPDFGFMNVTELGRLSILPTKLRSPVALTIICPIWCMTISIRIETCGLRFCGRWSLQFLSGNMATSARPNMCNW